MHCGFSGCLAQGSLPTSTSRGQQQSRAPQPPPSDSPASLTPASHVPRHPCGPSPDLTLSCLLAVGEGLTAPPSLVCPDAHPTLLLRCPAPRPSLSTHPSSTRVATCSQPVVPSPLPIRQLPPPELRVKRPETGLGHQPEQCPWREAHCGPELHAQCAPTPTAASPGRPGGWPQGHHVRGTSGKSHTPVLGPSTRRTPTLPWPLFSASLWLQDQLGCQCLCRARGQEGAGGPRGPGRWARSRGVGSVKASQGYLCRQSAASLLFGKLEAGGEGAGPAPRKAVLHTRVAPAPPAGHPLWGQ